jgi:hypothetical protein
VEGLSRARVAGDHRVVIPDLGLQISHNGVPPPRTDLEVAVQGAAVTQGVLAECRARGKQKNQPGRTR